MINSTKQLLPIANKFAIDGEILSINLFGDGYINATYLVQTTKARYILQKMNTTVFANIPGLMANVCSVTEYLQNLGVETLQYLPLLTGEKYLDDKECFRMCKFVENTISYQVVENNQVFENVGYAFGQFQNQLSNFDATSLCEVIPNFHHTPKRVDSFLQAVRQDAFGRADSCQKEIDFVLQHKDNLSLVVDGLADGTIPLRVTHNDTKLNNILMDATTKKARAVIDLDTIMPGSMLYDFGDAIRSGASSATEDETDIAKVRFCTDKFASFAKGFCSAVKDTITPRERQLLPYCCYLMTMECGIRFLTDYLQNDVYFSTSYDTHNLVRCRTQFALARQIQQQFDTCKSIIDKVLG